MYTPSPEMLEKFKRIFKEEYGKEFKDDREATEAANNLIAFVDIALEVAMREAKRKKRLEKEPKGFHFEENGDVFSCRICYESVSR